MRNSHFFHPLGQGFELVHRVLFLPPPPAPRAAAHSLLRNSRHAGVLLKLRKRENAAQIMAAEFRTEIIAVVVFTLSRGHTLARGGKRAREASTNTDLTNEAKQKA